jgi:hypothetical protein
VGWGLRVRSSAWRVARMLGMKDWMDMVLVEGWFLRGSRPRAEPLFSWEPLMERKWWCMSETDTQPGLKLVVGEANDRVR